jgi:hypothetical protein
MNGSNEIGGRIRSDTKELTAAVKVEAILFKKRDFSSMLSRNSPINVHQTERNFKYVVP